MALTLGLDIGKSSIRGALLRTSLRSQEVERYLEVPVSALDASNANTDVVRAAIQELMGQLTTPPDHIIVALDGTRCSLRQVELPALARKRAADVLPFELDPLLPFPVEEALVDFQEIRQRGDKLDLMAAAVPETVVGETLESLKEAGVTPRELAVGAAALDGLLLFTQPPPGDTWLILHFDLDRTDVAFMRNGSCELARTLDEGVEAAQAQPQTLRFALSQTLMKYRGDGGPLPAQVFVSGIGADDPAFVSWVGQTLNLPAEAVLLPPAKGGVTPASVFGKALALAARMQRRGKRIDMRRGKYALPRGMTQLRSYALLAAGCATALLCSYVFSVWAEYRVLAEERDALQEKLAEVTEERFGERTTSPIRARELLITGGLRKDPLPRFDAFRVLAAISEAIPESIKHDTRELEIELDETGQTGKLHLEGTIDDLAARDQVALAIEAHECIGELERGKTSTVPGEDRKRYILDGEIACPGAAPKKSSKGKGK